MTASPPPKLDCGCPDQAFHDRVVGPAPTHQKFPDCALCAPCRCDDECDCNGGVCAMCGHMTDMTTKKVYKVIAREEWGKLGALTDLAKKVMDADALLSDIDDLAYQKEICDIAQQAKMILLQVRESVEAATPQSDKELAAIEKQIRDISDDLREGESFTFTIVGTKRSGRVGYLAAAEGER